VRQRGPDRKIKKSIIQIPEKGNKSKVCEPKVEIEPKNLVRTTDLILVANPRGGRGSHLFTERERGIGGEWVCCLGNGSRRLRKKATHSHALCKKRILD